jgi:hypothetical protein
VLGQLDDYALRHVPASVQLGTTDDYALRHPAD